MKENCAICKHHDVFWEGSGCNLLNHMEQCRFELLLKPCPFCGGEAFIYYSGSPGNGEFSEVICKKCKCQTDRLRGDKAIEVWNRRVNDGK